MNTGPILLVDDEPLNLAALEAALGDKYRLVFARNGAEAIAATRKHTPSLILLDVQMPDMDGYAVCRQLKADRRTESIPVVFVTGLADVGHEADGFNAGGVDYIIKPISRDILLARIHTHLSLVRATELEQSHRDAIHMLGEAGHFNDADTGVHIWRMAAYAGRLAAACGLSEEVCKRIELAAPMHDTGKIGIRQSILKKPGKLDATEWAEMKTHPRIGYNILCRSDAPVFQMAAAIALHHHERWDGSGYPDGLCGEDIPLAARIVALADVFDALTMKRPYKDSWPLEQVMETVRAGAGNHFDPNMVRLFESILPDILAMKAEWDSREATGVHVLQTAVETQAG